MRSLAFFGIVIFALTSCDTNSDLLGKMYDFDQGPMLVNLGNELILPAYRDLSDKTESLKIATESFTESPSEEALVTLRQQLKAARLAWQQCAPFQFGPAEANNLSGILNIYPVDTRQIDRNISEGNYDLRTLSNADARGFQAMGYLLYDSEMTNEELVASFDTNRSSYLLDLAVQIAEVSSVVYSEWSVEGANYLGDFTSEAAYGVSVGSSVAKLVNAMNLNFERNTRDGKVGIPVGIRSLGEPVLHATEAYFSGYSVELLQANLTAYHRLYTGGSGEGLDDYLKAIEATTTSNEDLSATINTQFETLIAAVDKLNDPLPEQITTDKVAVEAVFAEMQRLIVLFKTDMASSMGVVITYQDNDGD